MKFNWDYFTKENFEFAKNEFKKDDCADWHFGSVMFGELEFYFHTTLVGFNEDIFALLFDVSNNKQNFGYECLDDEWTNMDYEEFKTYMETKMHKFMDDFNICVSEV